VKALLIKGIQCPAINGRPSKLDLLTFIYNHMTLGVGDLDDKFIITANINSGANMVPKIY
jgi:hypothetical protein